MKKFLTLILAAACVITLAACTKQEKEEQGLQQDFVPGQHIDVEEETKTEELPAPGTSGPSKPVDTEIVYDACPYSVMYQGVQYITWANEAARDAFQELKQVGEVKSLVPTNQMPTEELQSNAFEVGTKLWSADGQLLVETDDPDVLWVFRGWVKDGQTVVTDTVASLGHGTMEAAVNLTLDDAEKLRLILKKGDWNTEGTADCLNDCVLTLYGQELYYHSDCGTFNVPGTENGGACLMLDDETQEQVNGILEKYITLGWILP